LTTQEDSLTKVQTRFSKTTTRSRFEEKRKYPRRKRVFIHVDLFGQGEDTDEGERERRMWDRAGGRRKRWPPTIRSSLARSFTYSLSSLVSILSSLCVLLIYRAAGKCLRHSPSIVQPISLLFFLLLHLRVSSCHFLFPSPVRSPCERFAPFSAAPLSRFPHSLLRPEYID